MHKIMSLIRQLNVGKSRVITAPIAPAAPRHGIAIRPLRKLIAAVLVAYSVAGSFLLMSGAAIADHVPGHSSSPNNRVTDLRATALPGARIRLDWTTDVFDPLGDVFIRWTRVEVSTDSGLNWTLLNENGGPGMPENPAITYTHAGLSEGDTRHYRIFVYHDNSTSGEDVSPASNVASATALSATATVPAFCARNSDLQAKVIAAIADAAVTACANVTAAHLAALTVLDFGDDDVQNAMEESDFNGMTGLTTLLLHGNPTLAFAPGFFDEVPGVRFIESTLVNLSIDRQSAGLDGPDADNPGIGEAELTIIPPVLGRGGTTSDADAYVHTVDGYQIEASDSLSASSFTSIVDDTGDVDTYTESLPGGALAGRVFRRNYRIRPHVSISGTSELGPLGSTSLFTATVMPGANAPNPNVCTDRSTLMRDALVAAVDDVEHCRNLSTEHLAGVEVLDFSGMSIAALEEGDFRNLTGLTTLNLHDNDLTGLPDDIFTDLDSLTTLTLQDNDIERLPTDLAFFVRETDVVDVDLLAPFNLRVTGNIGSLILDWDAPPVRNFSSGDNGTVTGYRIQVSEFSGGPFTDLVPDTGDTETTYTHIGLLAGNTRHYRIAAFIRLGSSGTPTLSPNSVTQNNTVNADALGTPVCNRTPQVIDALLAQLVDGTGNPMFTDCSEVTAAALAGLETFTINGDDHAADITSLQAIDLNGLFGLRVFRIRDEQMLTEIPEQLFSENTALRSFTLTNTGVTTLPAGLFTSTPGLRIFDVPTITEFPTTLFDPLSQLNRFSVGNAENATIQFIPPAIADRIDDLVSGSGGLGIIDLGENALAPPVLTATSSMDGVLLEWVEPLLGRGDISTEQTVVGYRIEVSTDGETYSEIIADTGEITTSHLLTGFGDADMRYFRVSTIFTVPGANPANSNRLSPVATAVPFIDSPPVADPGPDRTVPHNTLVRLNGFRSMDVNGDDLSYLWTQIAPTSGTGANLTLEDAMTRVASFTGPQLAAGADDVDLVFTLTVRAGIANHVATITITVSEDPPPVADAGPDQTNIPEDTRVMLDGSSSSDPENDPLSYAWTQLSPTSGPGSNVVLSDPSAVTPSFAGPAELLNDVVLVFQLVVTSEDDNSQPDMVTISISAGVNDPPVADAGNDVEAGEGTEVRLNGGQSSDPESEPLAFSWVQIAPESGNPGADLDLRNADRQIATFITPSDIVDEIEVVFELTVSIVTDETIFSTDQVTITLLAGANDPPTAEAGPNQRVAVGDMVTLDGSESSDPENEVLTYEWVQIDNGEPTVVLSDDTAVMPTFEFPEPAEGRAPGELIFRLTVTDARGLSSPLLSVDRVTITPTGTFDALNALILPEIARAISGTTSAITSRIQQGGQAAGLTVGGQNSLAGVLYAHGESVLNDEVELKTLLRNSNFNLPFNRGDDVRRGFPNYAEEVGFSSMAVWGSGDYRGISGESELLKWDGSMEGFHLGFDGRMSRRTLGGLAFSWMQANVEYTGGVTTGFGSGDYEISIRSVNPYLAWTSGNFRMWATAGYGEGEMGVTRAGEDEMLDGDINLVNYGAGFEHKFFSSDITSASFRGEVSETMLEIEQDDNFGAVERGADRSRLAFAASQSHHTPGGGVIEPSIEIGARFDGGDSGTSGGAELGGGMRYRHPANRLSADVRARSVLVHNSDYSEWGVEGSLRLQPRRDLQGWSFHVRPGYGDSGSRVQQLWRDGLLNEDTNDDPTADYTTRLDARLGYGLSLRTRDGTITPYSEMLIGNADTYRMGVNLRLPAQFSVSHITVNLSGERHQPQTAPVENSILLKGEVRF